MAGDDPDELQRTAVDLCAKAFGTDAGARRADLRQPGHRRRRARRAGRVRADRRDRTDVPATTGWDIVAVTLRKADLERVPESRIHTALEASLNCEVHIRTT